MKRNGLTPRRLAVSCAVAGALTCSAAPASATAIPFGDLEIRMQEQEKSNWCWDASGNTIADFWGHQLTQTEFCQIAHNESGDDCANEQGYLSDQQRVFRYLGFSSAGTYNDWGETLDYGAVKQEIDAGQPIGTRILWTSGGGHMHVIYGYDDAGGRTTVSYGDPLQGAERYNSMDHDAYLSNGEFSWTHTVYGIRG
ncbi:papain-like cysteine protease family protein [Saccharopolyspora taberi]|uniref:Papain-like cysteine protease family protein n=1 Tax=Saccharopolyspora taberi TaxID=60895 RepID=A0ABN3V4F2_9PSEU